MDPILESFEWKPSERFGVKVLLLLPDCDVCGHRMDDIFLQNWNGKRVCTKCKNEIYEEMERFN